MIRFLDTNNKRKSALITSILMGLLLVSLFYFGMKYFDPPKEYGIAVNFGTSNVGMGKVQPNKIIKTPLKNSEIKDEVQKEKIKSTPTKAVEKVLTQNTEESIVIKQKKEAKRKADELAKKQKAIEKAKKDKLDALIGGINNANEASQKGEGNDTFDGDKGKINGDRNANGYYGNGGGGGKGDYNLGSRKPMNKPKPDYICNEEGVVVVRIEVDNFGRVQKASPGVKGSTNTSPCLLNQAKKAALKTKWQADSKAPSKQIGTIKYRFSLAQ